MIQEQLLRLALAVIVGGAVGFEREYHEKAAGLRTITLVCVGAALFTMFAEYAAGRADAVRLAAGVVTGIGFLGAGVIMRDHGQVTGMTTAATIWVAAALGVGLGFGAYWLIGIATVVVLAVLWIFPRLDLYQRANDTMTFDLTATYDKARYTGFMGRIAAHNLHIVRHTISRKGDDMLCMWVVYGKPDALTELAKEFIDDVEVKDFGVY